MEQFVGGEIILFITILCVLGVFLWLFVLIFIRRKNMLLARQYQAEKEFEAELAKAQVEIQQHTLRNISWELHDNIGQLLTLAKIQAQNAQEKPAELVQAIDSIGEALNELRDLSIHINPESLKNLKLHQAIMAVTDRFNRLGVIVADTQIKGTPIALNAQEELLLFRIVQEFFTNTIKYAKAKKLNVVCAYSENTVAIACRDNGIGFDPSQIHEGLGLRNMRHRAAILGAELLIQSELKKGTTLELTYKKDSYDS